VILAILGGITAGGFYVWNTYEDKIRAFMGWEEPKPKTTHAAMRLLRRSFWCRLSRAFAAPAPSNSASAPAGVTVADASPQLEALFDGAGAANARDSRHQKDRPRSPSAPPSP
jgi:hypothetical protein